MKITRKLTACSTLATYQGKAMEQRTYITRSWRATIGFLIGAIVPLSISVLLVVPVTEFHGWLENSIGSMLIWVIAVFLLFPASILLWWSFFAGGSAACPACGS